MFLYEPIEMNHFHTNHFTSSMEFEFLWGKSKQHYSDLAMLCNCTLNF